jgi:hypothetical protein
VSRTTFAIAFGLAIVISANSYADLVVGYAVLDNVNPVGPNNGVGVTGINLSRGAGLSDGGASTDFVGADWDGEATDYFEFGFSASATPWDLSQLQLRTNRSGTGPNSIDVQVAINGGSFSSVGSFAPPAAQTNFIVDLSALDSVSSVIFRLFGSGSTNPNGTFRIEDNGNFLGGANDLVIEGAAVPEGSSVAAMGLVAILSAVVALKKRQRQSV